MSAFLKGIVITLLAAAVLQASVGFYFDGLPGAVDALRAMLFYWFAYVGVSAFVGVVGLVVHRRRQRTSQAPET
jgi:hypothetical protein